MSDEEYQRTWIAKLYTQLFPDLRRKTDEFHGFNPLKDWNYDAARQSDKLFSNFTHTEIDIVLATPNHLFIGEAKHESGLTSSSKYVLVHQLIREYVTANILVELLRYREDFPPLKVVPFMVVNCPDDFWKNEQVRFMVKQQWLKKENVLSWSDICKL